MDAQKILVIDDEFQITRVLKRSLQAHRYDVRTAADGESGLELFHDFHPDLVITDLSMPAMNGIEVCREIRKMSETPIIVLSVKGEERTKVEALDAGADDYMTKPFDPNELIARINAILRRVKGRYISSEREDRMEELTFQEQKILQYMEEGYTNKEIAFNLSLTEGTVKVYNHIIYQKLQLKNRTQAIVRAKELNII